MRLSTPRIEPLSLEEMDSESRGLFGGGPVLNIFRTLAHHPKLMKRFMVFGAHILSKSSLSARDRELVILRVGWLCRAEYEFAQHTQIARDSGIDDGEIARVTRGPAESDWSDAERALLQATDELHSDAFVSDATWEQLGQHFERKQIMDLVFTVGQYNMVSMALNTFGVQLEEGAARFPGT